MSALPVVAALTLAEATRIVEDALRDHSYRRTPIGREITRYLRSAELEPRSYAEYESTLYRLALQYAHLQLTDLAPPIGTERLEEFIDRHWGASAAGTRRKNISILSSFFSWAYERERIAANPIPLIRRPKRKRPDRRAHPPARVLDIVRAQPLARDRVALLLLAKMGLRKNELRLLQIRDLDLERALVRLQQKGGDVVYHSLVFPDLLAELADHFLLDAREPDEYLLHPRWERTLRTGATILQREARDRPMSPRGVHEWFARCLTRAGVPHFPMHELRHTAGTEYLRATHDLELTRKFMRHANIATTSEFYAHLNDDDLRQGGLLAARRWDEA